MYTPEPQELLETPVGLPLASSRPTNDSGVVLFELRHTLTLLDKVKALKSPEDGKKFWKLRCAKGTVVMPITFVGEGAIGVVVVVPPLAMRCWL